MGYFSQKMRFIALEIYVSDRNKIRHNGKNRKVCEFSHRQYTVSDRREKSKYASIGRGLRRQALKLLGLSELRGHSWSPLRADDGP